MGPLAGIKDIESLAKQKREVAKMLADEARKERLNKMKMATELAKARKEGLPIDQSLKDFAPPPRARDVMPRHVAVQAKPTNPEAGPRDTVPALLTPGEAVIPAPVAQDPQYKQIIQGLVNKGRELNAALGEKRAPESAPLGGMSGHAQQLLSGRGAQLQAQERALGLSDGTPAVKKEESFGQMIDRLWNAGSKSKQQAPAPAPVPKPAPSVGSAAKDLKDRHKNIDKAVQGLQQGTARVKSPLGFEDGSVAVASPVVMPGMTDAQVRGKESGDDPLAQNPESTAKGLYQITEAAMTDVHKVRPDLAQLDFADRSVQQQYRDTYKNILTAQLKAKGVEPTPQNIDRAWVVGAGGLRAVKGADPNTPLSAVLSPEAIAKNPNLQGKTTGEFATDPNPYSRKTTSEVAQRAVVGDKPVTLAPPIGTDEPEKRTYPRNHLEALTGQNISHPPRNTLEALMGKRVDDPSLAVPKPITQRLPQVKSEPHTPVELVDLTKEDIDRGDLDSHFQLSSTHMSRLENLDRINADESTQNAIRELQGQKPEGGMMEWLSKQFAKIYGDKGLFNERELIKFSILAAGGIATGASIGGSVRFAAAAAMSSAENRHQSQQAEERQVIRDEKAVKVAEATWLKNKQAEASKDVRERLQTLENTYHTALGHASDEARAKGLELFQQARQAKTAGEREALLQGAIQTLAVGREGTVPTKKVDTFYNQKTGEPTNGYMDPKTATFMKFNPVTKAYESDMSGDYIDSAEDTKRKTEFFNQTKGKLAYRIDRANRDRDNKPIIPGLNAELHAAGLTHEAELIRRDLGLDAKSASVVVETAYVQMLEGLKGQDFDKKVSPEGFRRYIYGNAVIETRKVSGNLYKATDGDGKKTRPSYEATGEFSDVLRSVKDQPEFKGDTTAAVKYLEDKWSALPDEQKKTFTDRARGRAGYSPFLLWVSEIK